MNFFLGRGSAPSAAPHDLDAYGASAPYWNPKHATVQDCEEQLLRNFRNILAVALGLCNYIRQVTAPFSGARVSVGLPLCRSHHGWWRVFVTWYQISVAFAAFFIFQQTL